MNALFRRIAATLSLLALFSSVPLSFVHEKKKKNIVIIGDSQGDGFKAPMKTYLESQGFRVIKTITHSGEETRSFLGAGGHLSRDGFNSISEPVYGVVVFLGGNDCGCASANGNVCQANDCGDNLQTSLASFVNTIKQKTNNIVWIGTMWSNGQPSTNGSITLNTHRATSQIQQSTLPSLGVKWYQGLNKGIDYPLDRYQAHFVDGGYAALTQCIGPLIKGALDGGNPADRECRYGITSPTENDNTNTGSTAPVTDTLGRTQEDVNRSIAARCEDTNPVFPVTLGISIGGVSQVNGLTEYINVVYRYLTSIVLVVAIVMVTYGGFRYLVSATPLGVSDGKDIIKNGIVGMVLVLGAYVILNTINPATTILQFTRPPVDIVCRNFEANFLYSTGAGSGNLFSPRGESTGLNYYRNQFDPLGLRNRPLGQQCSSVAGVELDLTCPGSDTECVEADAFLEAVNNVNNADDVRDNVNYCSDGSTLYSLCEDQSDCKNGLICHPGWQVCVQPTGNAEGSPCAVDTYGTCGDSRCVFSRNTDHPLFTCATGLECRDREHNAPNENIFVKSGLKVCTRVSLPLQHNEITAFNNGIADPNRACNAHRECGTGDNEARCSGSPVVEGKLRACLSTPTNLNGAPCGKVWADSNGATVSVYPCDGANGYTCAYCPNSGSRVWTSIQGQAANYIGQCKPNAQSGGGQSEGRIGDNCAGS